MLTPFLCLPKRIPLRRGCVLYTPPQGSIHQFTMARKNNSITLKNTICRGSAVHKCGTQYKQLMPLCMDCHGFCDSGLPLQKITPPTRYHGFQRLQASKKDRAVADGRTVPISFPLTNCPGKKHRFSGHPHRQFDMSWWVQLVSNSWCLNV